MSLYGVSGDVSIFSVVCVRVGKGWSDEWVEGGEVGS